MSASVYARIAERYQVPASDDEAIERFLLDIAPTLPREEREAILAELRDDEISRRPESVATDLPVNVPSFSIDDAPPVAQPTSLTRLVGELCDTMERRIAERMDVSIAHALNQLQRGGAVSRPESSNPRVEQAPRVADLLEEPAVTVVEPESTVRAAAQRMAERNVGAVAVVTEGVLVGVFSMKDLMARVIAAGRNPDTTSVGSVMSKEIVVAGPDDDVESALQKMRAIRSRHLPVVNEGKLIGMISLRDLLTIEDDDAPNKARFLTELVTYSPDYES
jgi:CBS domain-containing protein